MDDDDGGDGDNFKCPSLDPSIFLLKYFQKFVF